MGQFNTVLLPLFSFQQPVTMQNEYIDLPINLQDTPNPILEKTTPNLPPSVPQEAAHQILKKLQELIKGNQQDLYTYCQTVLPATYNEHFVNKQWPKPNHLEETYDTQYKIGAQTIYNEFALRTTFECLKEDNEDYWLDLVDLSWETYTSIFQLEGGRIEFHPMLIWTYFENFLIHYNYYNQEKSKVSQEKIREEWFNYKKIISIFEILQKSIPSTFSSNLKPIQIFGYYSIVAEALLLSNEGKYEESLKAISGISLKETLVFSKGCGALLNLFFTTSFCYFMMGENNKSIKLCETIVAFFQKYRKYFSKSIHEKDMVRVHEKNVALLCINHIFLEEKPKPSTMDIFKNTSIKYKEKHTQKISDCFYKMKQSDNKTFIKLLSVIRNGFSLQDIESMMVEKFKKIQQITLFTIVQNYKRIELKKMAKMLNMSQDDVIKEIKNFAKIPEGTTNWESTILNPLLKQRKKINVEIVENIAIFESQSQDNSESAREWQRYRDEVNWLIEKVNKI